MRQYMAVKIIRTLDSWQCGLNFPLLRQRHAPFDQAPSSAARFRGVTIPFRGFKLSLPSGNLLRGACCIVGGAIQLCSI